MLDYQNIYRKDHKENIRIFQDLKTIKEFSSYANDLNRIFGDNSYNQFHKNLNEPKQIIGDNYMRLFQKSDNKNAKFKIFEEHFNLKQFRESLSNMKIKDKILKDKIQFPYFERMKQSRNYLLKKEMEKYKSDKPNKSFFPNVPEVGRYNPKYNSINKHSYRAFFGNVPTNRFYTIDQEVIKNDLDNPEKNDDNDNENEQIKRKFIIKSNIFNKSNNMKINNHFSLKNIVGNRSKISSAKKLYEINNNTETNDNSNIIKENKSQKFFILKNNNKNSNNISNISDNNSINNSFNNSPKKSNNNSSIEVDNNSSFNKSIKINNIKDNNHCLKFETYTSRKPLNKTIIYNTDIRTELPNYYSPKYIKNYINFNNNKNALSYLEQKIKRDQNPPIGFYEPKYNYVFNNIDKNVYINKNSLLNSSHHSIKKIFCDYNVSKDYQTVPSLNNDDNENEEADNNEENNNKSEINDDIKSNNKSKNL